MLKFRVDRSQLTLGETVRGQGTWTAEKDVSPRSVTLRVGWRTAGRGTPQTGFFFEKRVEPGPVRAGQTVDIDFECRLPDQAPVSYEGKLIRVLWEVSIQVDLPWAFDENGAELIHVGPRRVPA